MATSMVPRNEPAGGRASRPTTGFVSGPNSARRSCFSRAGRGATTLVALCLTTALAVAVGGYLALMMQEQRMGARHQQNDQARELIEIGFEESLWALNQNNWGGAGPASATAWTTSGTSHAVTLDYPGLSGGNAGRLELTVADFASSGPVWPTITVKATVTTADGRAVTRTEQAVTGPLPLFGHALASAEAGVTFVSGGTVDSWNSDPDNNPATPAVAYAFAAGNAANYNAVVAGADADGTNGVVLTRAEVLGYVATTGKPVAYSTSGAPRGRIQGPATAAGVDVDPLRIGRSAFVPFTPVFQVSPPAASGTGFGGLLGSVLALVNALLSAPADVSVYKINGDLLITGVPLLFPNLTVDRPLKLIVDGNLTISGAGQITVTSTGSLELFVNGDCTIGGNGINNQNTEPAKCAVFCLDTSTANTLTYTTTRDFRGVIYCENKPIDIRQNATCYGALLSRRQIGFTTSATAPVIHFDTALRSTRFENVSTPYVILQRTTL